MNELNKVNSKNIFEEEISLVDIFIKFKKLLKIIKSYYKFLLLSIFIGIVIGLFLFKNQEIKYKAEINFVLEDGQTNNTGGLASQLGINIGGQKSNLFSGETFFAFMKSRFLLEKTLLTPIKLNGDEISLIEFYRKEIPIKNKNKMPKDVLSFVYQPYQEKTKLSLNQIQFLNSVQSDISNNFLEIKPKDKKSSILTISVISPSEKFSKIFCDKIAEVVSNFYIEIANKKARINLEILEKQTDSIRIQLEKSLNDAAYASDRIYNLNPSKLINKVSSSKKQIDVQANTAILSQLIANLESARVSVRKETPLIQIIDSPTYPLDPIKNRLIKYLFISFVVSIISMIIIILTYHFYFKK
jgi:hypothetical protein